MLPDIKEKTFQTAEATDPFYRVRSELQKIEPTSRLRYSNQFAKDAHVRFDIEITEAHFISNHLLNHGCQVFLVTRIILHLSIKSCRAFFH